MEPCPTDIMFSLSPAEHNSIPKEIYNWRVYFASIVATFAAVIIGYVLCLTKTFYG